MRQGMRNSSRSSVRRWLVAASRCVSRDPLGASEHTDDVGDTDTNPCPEPAVTFLGTDGSSQDLTETFTTGDHARAELMKPEHIEIREGELAHQNPGTGETAHHFIVEDASGAYGQPYGEAVDIGDHLLLHGRSDKPGRQTNSMYPSYPQMTAAIISTDNAGD